MLNEMLKNQSNPELSGKFRNFLKQKTNRIIQLLFFILFILYIFEIPAIDVNKVYSDWYSIRGWSGKSTIAENNILYIITLNGLEIYHIDESGTLEFISRLTIPLPNRLVKINNNLYITSYFPDNDHFPKTLYKIDITDPNNPVIVNERILGFPGIDIQKFGDILLLTEYIDEFTIIHHLIDAETLTDISSFARYSSFDVISDDIIVEYGEGFFNLCEIDSSGSLSVISTYDYSAQTTINQCYYKLYNNRYLFRSIAYEVYIYDLMEIENPQYVTKIQYSTSMVPGWDRKISFYENNLILVLARNILLYNIEDIENPILTYQGESRQSIDVFSTYINNIYTMPFCWAEESIDHYQITDNFVNFISSFSHKKSNNGLASLIDSNKIILCQYNNTKIVEIEDDLTLSHYSNSLPNYSMYEYHKSGEWCIYKTGLSEGKYKIYSFSDINNPQFFCDIEFDTEIDYICYYPYLDPFNPDVVYFFNYSAGKMCKFLLQENNAVMLYEQNIPNYTSARIQDDIIFIVYSTEYPRMNIFQSVNDELELLNSIDQLDYLGSMPYIRKFNDYICVYTDRDDDISYYYHLEEDYSLTSLFVAENAELVFIDDNLLFTKYKQIIKVYDLSDISAYYLQPIAVTHGLNYIYNLLPYEADGEKYFYSIEMADIGLFHYTTDSNSNSPVIINKELSLTNYPNPFNPETTISFNLTTENSENTELIIYNIKGQKIKSFSNLQINKSLNQQIIWNGTDETNQPVSSGVYFYRLISGNFQKTKKCLLMK